MTTRNLAEVASVMIRDCIKANISAALAGVRTLHPGGKVTTEDPVNYFFFEKAQAFQCPAVFIICQDIDFRKEEMRANHVNAKDNFGISILIEDKDQEALTIKAWRYQAALHEILDERQLTIETPNNIKLVIEVVRATFSPIFTTAGAEPNNFRKEILLDCDVYHYENF